MKLHMYMGHCTCVLVLHVLLLECEMIARGGAGLPELHILAQMPDILLPGTSHCSGQGFSAMGYKCVKMMAHFHERFMAAGVSHGLGVWNASTDNDIVQIFN